MDSLKFPIGGFELPAEISEQHIEKAVTQLEQLPFTLRQLVSDWSDTQLDTPYREGGCGSLSGSGGPGGSAVELPVSHPRGGP